MAKPLKVKLEEGKLVVSEAAQLQPGDEVSLIIVDSKPDESSKKLDLYKLEYTQTQEHYRDGYRAVWTNFSYISIAVAAILALGSRAPGLPLGALLFLSGLLYAFWWGATFRPLDDYGEERADILQEIERKVNGILNDTVLTHWTRLNNYRRSRRWRVKNVINWLFAPVVFATIVVGVVLLLAGYLRDP